jgi:SRSO17 transposase
VVEVVTIEDIADWDADPTDLTDGLGWLFNRPEPKVTFVLVVRALLADVPQKNSWGLAEHAGLATPQPFEHLLGGAKWDAEALRDFSKHVLDALSHPDGALVLDDTQAIGKGDKSARVASQHCGLRGQDENLPAHGDVSAASAHGHRAPVPDALARDRG